MFDQENVEYGKIKKMFKKEKFILKDIFLVNELNTLTLFIPNFLDIS